MYRWALDFFVATLVLEAHNSIPLKTHMALDGSAESGRMVDRRRHLDVQRIPDKATDRLVEPLT